MAKMTFKVSSDVEREILKHAVESYRQGMQNNMRYRQKPIAPGEIPPLPLHILKEFNTLKTLVIGRLKNKQNKLPKAELESISGEDLTILAFKFIIENKIFAIDSLSLGIKHGHVKDFASFCKYYDIRPVTEEDE